MKLFLFFILYVTTLLSCPKAVIFDYGGVLAIPNKPLLDQFLCATFAINTEELKRINRQFISSKDPSFIEFLLRQARERNISLSKRWEKEFQEILNQTLGIDHSMYALIEQLKKQCLVGLLSNVGPLAARIIREAGWYEPFDPCLLSCEINADKPELKAYTALLKSLPYQSFEIVFIDDRIENIEAAKQLSIDAILFQSKQQLQQELEARGLSVVQ